MLDIQASPNWKPVFSFPCDAADEGDYEGIACLGDPQTASSDPLGLRQVEQAGALEFVAPTSINHQLPPGFCLVLTTDTSSDPICTFEASLCPEVAAYIAANSPCGPSTPPRPDISPHSLPSTLCSWHSVPAPEPAPRLLHRPRAAATGPPSATLVKRPRSPASPASSLKRTTSPTHSAMHAHHPTAPCHHPPAHLARRSSPATVPHPSPCTHHITPLHPLPRLPSISASTPDTVPHSLTSVSPPATPPAAHPAPSTPTYPSTSTPNDHTTGLWHATAPSTIDPLLLHQPHRTPQGPLLTSPGPPIPTEPQFLDATSRILLCVPDALLKEVVKVPLATAADKFLYSVVPSSPDVLPVYSLGSGAFGTVKLVYVETPPPAQELRMCAVKSVVPSAAYGEVDFWKEVEVMEACRGCPYVLHLFSAHVADGVCHLLMEVAGNGCLRDLLWAASTYDEAGLPVRGFSEEAARYLVAGLLVALQHLHSLDIAHLDIKPENVLLDAELRAKLADFGVTRCLRGQPTPTDIVGTPGYQPPEMLNGHGYGVAADMWACGMVAYQLVAGDLPEEWVVELLLKKGIFRPPAGLSQELEDLLLQLLAVDPTRRLTAAQARAHPWFDTFDWASFTAGTMPRPSIPIYHRLPDQRADSVDPAAGHQQA